MRSSLSERSARNAARNFISRCGKLRSHRVNELIGKATYDQRSYSIVHIGHLYESHFPILREELEGFHGEAVLGESILDLFLSYCSPGRAN